MATLLTAGWLAACSTPDPEIPDTPVETLYNNAKDSLDSGQPEKAAKLFDEVERQHPYSKWATQAQLMSAYSYYQVDKYDDAIPALERFIELHPGNRSAAYAFYLRALCYYEQIEDVTRDQGNTELAQRALSDVVARFPNTPYSRDATVKLDLVRDHLAGKEMDVGRYYQKRGQYLAAINRFKTVVDKFQTTSHVPEALERLTESYVALGVFAEAQKTTAVLGYNYPGSQWYQDAYALITSKGLTPEGSEADAPIALVDPATVKGLGGAATTEATPDALTAPPSDVAPAPDAVPVDPVTGLPLSDASAAPVPAAPSDGGQGPALSTNSTEDLMAPEPGNDPSGEQVLLPPGETPAPQ
ncbi:outer membrane protein assembly factor BamD [Dongia rigui]|uniref:Outer membrane protein assembly factor BamD n=1 Tax=Dongia rigui TaxID=940149 RepID=A0ABU5DV06_9PROT|nr:outer membrane protein assembly factor BamD [Dongia rigui]MDY0871122.1 outer membrane protein assembly factor BamD [Dongia rigui]